MCMQSSTDQTQGQKKTVKSIRDGRIYRERLEGRQAVELNCVKKIDSYFPFQTFCDVDSIVMQANGAFCEDGVFQTWGAYRCVCGRVCRGGR